MKGRCSPSREKSESSQNSAGEPSSSPSFRIFFLLSRKEAQSSTRFARAVSSLCGAFSRFRLQLLGLRDVSAPAWCVREGIKRDRKREREREREDRGVFWKEKGAHISLSRKSTFSTSSPLLNLDLLQRLSKPQKTQTGYPSTGAAPYYPGGYDPKYAGGPPPNYAPPQGYGAGAQQQPGMPGMMPPQGYGAQYPMQPPPAYGAPPPGQMAPPQQQQQKGSGCLTWLLSCACCCLFFEMCCN